MGTRTRRRGQLPGTGGMSYGQRPWPGIAAPDCHLCSWAYRGIYPAGRMEIKYLNAACWRYAHRAPDVMNVTSE